ncbi:MAG: Protein-L-isoaspartate O-methyltransferase [Alphaproteobacteria bacterium MarineAlpha2_Bin1]|nr:MAG: Protein-L-isoaspartate O-methyltransferase [Alphaproteobacteria bacterium MarineAlpha2_Bin1]
MKFEARKIRLIMDLRKKGITSTNVLSAIEKVPREKFIPITFIDQAYENSALPIEEGQTISQPFIVAFMTQALSLERKSKVLEIGTGSGYQSAVLSYICRRVFTIERFDSLLKIAQSKFFISNIHNIVTRHGDGYLGWPEQAPFDRIIVTAASKSVPEELVKQLAEGGIMVIPLEDSQKNQKIYLIKKVGEQIFTEPLVPVRFVPLVEGKIS